MQTIARVRTDFSSKFGVPRQSGTEGLRGEVVFEPPFRNPDAVRGLEGFSHIWLLWQFSLAQREGWSATVRPPRLGGNVRVGVFASRSPYRPNPIGLSSVRLEGIEMRGAQGPVLLICGVDMVDGTPVYDIKPYLRADAHPDAREGFSGPVRAHALRVNFPPELLARIPESLRAGLLEALRQDPRPSYQEDPSRLYGVPFAGQDVRFTVEGDVLTVREIGAVPGPQIQEG